jgi:hypothetical protein
MSKISLEGNASGSGTLTIAAPNTNSNYTLTLPQATTTLVGTDATQTLTNKTLTSPTITGANMSSMASSVITSGTSQASTSGTSIDFTGIPSWVKRITVMFSEVSTNGTSNYLFQLGDSGGIENTGYLGGGSDGSATNTLYTSGFGLVYASQSVSLHGSLVISLLDLASNKWSASGLFVTSNTTTGTRTTAGSKSLSATLDRVRITTVNGTDTFDAGSINILYE